MPLIVGDSFAVVDGLDACQLLAQAGLSQDNSFFIFDQQLREVRYDIDRIN